MAFDVSAAYVDQDIDGPDTGVCMGGAQGFARALIVGVADYYVALEDGIELSGLIQVKSVDNYKNLKSGRPLTQLPKQAQQNDERPRDAFLFQNLQVSAGYKERPAGKDDIEDYSNKFPKFQHANKGQDEELAGNFVVAAEFSIAEF